MKVCNLRRTVCLKGLIFCSFLFCVCWTVILSHPKIALAEGYVLADTGQTECFDNHKEIPCPSPGQPYYGQDANYQGVQPAYQDNGDETVTDLNTGLMWQQGDAQNKRGYLWQEAVDYCGALDLAGHSDWRLPTRRELASIADFGYSLFIVWGGDYWSGSTDANDPNRAWLVSGNHGLAVRNYYKNNHEHVRCVREGP